MFAAVLTGWWENTIHTISPVNSLTFPPQVALVSTSRNTIHTLLTAIEPSVLFVVTCSRIKDKIMMSERESGNSVTRTVEDSPLPTASCREGKNSSNARSKFISQCLCFVIVALCFVIVAYLMRYYLCLCFKSVIMSYPGSCGWSWSWSWWDNDIGSEGRE